MKVFTFLLKAEKSVWSNLDWSKLTTLCYVGWQDRELTTFAHQNNVTGKFQILYKENIKLNFIVVFIANYPKDQLLNTTYRKIWINQQLDYAVRYNLGTRSPP